MLPPVLHSTAQACPDRGEHYPPTPSGNAPKLQRPVIERDLVAPDSRTGPGRVGREPLQHRDREFEDDSIGRHGVLDAHHELGMQRPSDRTYVLHLGGLKDYRQVQGLDLQLDVTDFHLGREPIDQRGAAIVDPHREGAAARRERGHVPPRSRPAPEQPPVENCTIMPGKFLRNPSSSRPMSSGSELGAVIVGDMGTDQRRARLEGFLRRLDLFSEDDRNR